MRLVHFWYYLINSPGSRNCCVTQLHCLFRKRHKIKLTLKKFTELVPGNTIPLKSPVIKLRKIDTRVHI